MAFLWPRKDYHGVRYHDVSADSDIDPRSHQTNTLLSSKLGGQPTKSLDQRLAYAQYFIIIIPSVVVVTESVALHGCKSHLLIRRTPVPDCK